jgi:hypothetical protein
MQKPPDCPAARIASSCAAVLHQDDRDDEHLGGEGNEADRCRLEDTHVQFLTLRGSRFAPATLT